jgi:hypothetical protein
MTDPTTTAVVQRLLTNLQRLRTEHAELLDANRRLLSWGLTSGSVEILNRLRAIRCEADTIATRLHALGAVDDAGRAAEGWAYLPLITPLIAEAWT